MEEKGLVVSSNHAVSIAEIVPVSLDVMKRQIQAIQQAMRDVMIVDVHYGKIPGTDKPTLLKPGAEKLCMLFRLYPNYDEEIVERAGGHREVRIKCSLKTPSGDIVSQGIGACSTMESKYRWRKAERKCPSCQAEAIIKGKADYGGGWLCFNKKGGCGAKFADGDQSIEGQVVGRAENPDLADQYNTVAKMAAKRALVHAVVGATSCGDLFHQDLEDMDPADITPRKPAQAVQQPSAVSVQEKKPIAAQAAFQKEKKEIQGQGAINWEAFSHRYHLPPKKAGKDMDAVRAWLKERGFFFNPTDKHWYGNKLVEAIAEYLRPIQREGDDMPALDISEPKPTPVYIPTDSRVVLLDENGEEDNVPF